MIVKYIALILGTIFEVYSTSLYINSFLNKKNISKHKLIIIYFFILLFQMIASMCCQGIVLLFCSFITAFVIASVYQSQQYVKLILATTAIVINITSELIASGLIMLMQTVDFQIVNSDPYLFSIGTLISKFMMFILVLIVCVGKFKFSVENIGFKYLAVLSVLPITTIFMIIIMYQVMFLITDKKLKLMFVLASAFVMFSNVITFNIISKQNKLSKSEFELKLLKENINEQEKHYITLQESHEEIRHMRHDMKSMCMATIAELRFGNIDNAINQLSSNVNIIEETNRVIDTGHPSIDTIVETKLKSCKELDIEVNVSYCYKHRININEIEVAVILANILDNAIEACGKIESGKREIWGSVSVDRESVIINIKNSANKFNGFKTLKGDIKNHGYGLKSISHIANKNNGYAKFDYENGVFTSYVMLEN